MILESIGGAAERYEVEQEAVVTALKCNKYFSSKMNVYIFTR